MEIRKHNIPAHIDIENDIKKKDNGPITFVLRINAGNITDLTRPEVINPSTKYPHSQRDPLEQFTISSDTRKRGAGYTVRDNNGELGGEKRQG